MAPGTVSWNISLTTSSAPPRRSFKRLSRTSKCGVWRFKKKRNNVTVTLPKNVSDNLARLLTSIQSAPNPPSGAPASTEDDEELVEISQSTWDAAVSTRRLRGFTIASPVSEKSVSTSEDDLATWYKHHVHTRSEPDSSCEACERLKICLELGCTSCTVKHQENRECLFYDTPFVQIARHHHERAFPWLH
jgi:hypothetical protein